MANLKEVFKSMAIKAGYKADSPEIAEIMAADIESIEVADDVATALSGKLISMDAAKKHPEIAKIYRTEALDGVDRKIVRALDVLELSDDDRAAFLGETNTYNKLDKLSELIRAAKAGKADATTDRDKQDHSRAISSLNEELKRIKEEQQAERENFKNTRKNDLKDFALRGKIKNFKTILDSTSESAKFATCNTVINSLLDEYKAELVPDENGKLKLQTKTGDDVYNDKTNSAIDADSFLEMALSQNKLLTVAKPSEQHEDDDDHRGGYTTPPINRGQPNADKDKSTKAATDFNSQIAELISKQPR